MKLPVDHTKGEYWGGTQLNFNHLKWVSLLGGYFGLDHLLLRSPTSAALKFIGNLVTLGYFYWYDVLQVTVEADYVKEKGFRFPFLGEQGIGAGIFHADGKEPAPATSPKPYLFALYCIAVFIGFGFDFLLAGDYAGAATKMVTMFIPIFWIFTFIWWCYNILRTYAYTESTVLSKDAQNEKRGIARFFPVTLALDPYYLPNGRFIPLEPEKEPCEGTLGFPWNIFSAFITTPIKTAAASVIGPIETTAKAYASAAEATASAAAEGAAAVGKSVEAAGKLAERAPQILQVAAETLASAAPVPALPMKGGAGPAGTGDSLVLGGLAAVVLGGFGLTLFRGMKKNPEDDDHPPEPRTGRKSLL